MAKRNMDRFILLILLMAIIIISGCSSSYSPEVKTKLEECTKIIGWGECEMALAIKQNDASICKFIKNRYYGEVCKIAVAKNFEKCGDIKNWDFSEHKIESSDYNDMKKLAQKQAKAILTPTKSATIKTCYSIAAKLQNDINLCNSIEDKNDKNNCKLQFPDKFGIVEKCRSESSIYAVELCFQQEAIVNKNEALCNFIENINDRQICLGNFEVAVKPSQKTPETASVAQPKRIDELGLPDFEIVSLEYCSSYNDQGFNYAALNQPVAYSVRWRNIGAKKQQYNTIVMKVYLNGQEIHKEIHQDWSIKYHENGGIINTEPTDSKFTQKGDNKLKVIIDADNAIQESNEKNNEKEITINVS